MKECRNFCFDDSGGFYSLILGKRGKKRISTEEEKSVSNVRQKLVIQRAAEWQTMKSAKRKSLAVRKERKIRTKERG